MYDEVMQLIALAKNDEQYFKRIEELKQKQLEVAHVLEIAKTLQDADQHLAKARQDASEIVATAEKEALTIKGAADAVVNETKVTLEKAKAKLLALKEKETRLDEKEKELKLLEKEKQDSIDEHRKLTAARSVEFETSQKIRKEFEDKLKKMRELANS